jgi:hypothetical protein
MDNNQLIEAIDDALVNGSIPRNIYEAANNAQNILEDPPLARAILDIGEAVFDGKVIIED